MSKRDGIYTFQILIVYEHSMNPDRGLQNEKNFTLGPCGLRCFPDRSARR